MEKRLETLAKLLRYAGLNLTPQIIQIVLDKHVIKLITTLDAKVTANPNLSLADIDEVLAIIQKEAEGEAIAMAEADDKEKALKADSKSPLEKV